jgi:hypothetical protein
LLSRASCRRRLPNRRAPQPSGDGDDQG